MNYFTNSGTLNKTCNLSAMTKIFSLYVLLFSTISYKFTCQKSTEAMNLFMCFYEVDMTYVKLNFNNLFLKI